MGGLFWAQANTRRAFGRLKSERSVFFGPFNMDELLKKVDFSDPTTEVVIVVVVLVVGMLFFWLMQGDKGRV
jgi:hypothetical protein